MKNQFLERNLRIRGRDSEKPSHVDAMLPLVVTESVWAGEHETDNAKFRTWPRVDWKIPQPCVTVRRKKPRRNDCTSVSS